MNVIQRLPEIDFLSWMITGFLILSMVIAIYEIIGTFSKIIGKPVTWVKSKDNDHELLMKTAQRVLELQTANVETLSSLSELSRKIDIIQQTTDARFLESTRRHDKRIRAELKDKISDSYRRYHSINQINKMELEALEGLIEEYESAKGENSFVHSVVQKEMYTWEQIE